MMLSRASTLLRAAPRTIPMRALAIAPTCKTAPDTSAMDFPAPSHVSITAQAADVASQLKAFYSNPESVVSLPDEARVALRAEITKKVAAIPDNEMSDSYSDTLDIPTEVRIGDIPLFKKGGK